MKPWLLAAAVVAGWYFWLRPRNQVFTDTRLVDPARFMPWPRGGVDPGALIPRAPYTAIDPGR